MYSRCYYTETTYLHRCCSHYVLSCVRRIGSHAIETGQDSVHQILLLPYYHMLAFDPCKRLSVSN